MDEKVLAAEVPQTNEEALTERKPRNKNPQVSKVDPQTDFNPTQEFMVQLAEMMKTMNSKFDDSNKALEASQKRMATAGIEIEKRVKNLEMQQRSFAERIAKDKRNYVTFSIPKVYAEYAPSITAMINGVTVKVKADGKPVRIHKVFASALQKKLDHLDDKIANMRDGGQITRMQNF